VKPVFLFLSSLLLIACLSGCKDSVPKCSDDDTLSLVKNILAEQIGESEGASAAEMTTQMVIQYPRASAYTESIKKYECEAKLLAAGTYELPITYESQIDDSGQHIVAVGGIQRGDLFQVALAIVGKVRQSREEAAKARAVAKPRVPTQVQTASQSPKAQPPPSAPPAAAPKTKPAAASNDVPPAVKSFMERSYGRYDSKHACWRTEYESQAYCMKVIRMDRITADTGERFYLLVGGPPLDDDGEPESVHALSGLVGAFVFEIRESNTDLVASNLTMYVGASGVVPEQWDLVKLAKTGYYGWRTTWGDCHQGYCGNLLTILAPFGKSVKDIAALNISYTDAGACEGQECPEGASSVESKVTIDTTTNSDIYPLTVAFSGTLNGRSLNGTSRRLEFDRKAWRYAVPDDWPLAGVEF
jgi:hypothetical protein